MSQIDPLCVQTTPNDRGKWHMSADSTMTSCGIEVVPQQGVGYRYLSLIDSRDRCKSQACTDARNQALGRT